MRDPRISIYTLAPLLTKQALEARANDDPAWRDLANRAVDLAERVGGKGPSDHEAVEKWPHGSWSASAAPQSGWRRCRRSGRCARAATTGAILDLVYQELTPPIAPGRSAAPSFGKARI
jgi:hypothetical protein